MRQGKVKWYNSKKCFGFISPDTPNEDNNTDDVFVHSSALKAANIRFLNENDIVEFEEEPRNGKLSVTTIKLIQRDEESARRFQEHRAERRRAREELGLTVSVGISFKEKVVKNTNKNDMVLLFGKNSVCCINFNRRFGGFFIFCWS